VVGPPLIQKITLGECIPCRSDLSERQFLQRPIGPD
jgi:hypothetical protein